MMSFSGRGEVKTQGGSIREIKLSVSYSSFPSTVIDTVLSHLKERLFYLSDEGLFFTNQPNLKDRVREKRQLKERNTPK